MRTEKHVLFFTGILLSWVSLAWAADEPPGWTTDIPIVMPYCTGGFFAEEIPLLERSGTVRMHAQQLQREDNLLYLQRDIEIVTESLLFRGEEAFYYTDEEKVEFIGKSRVDSPFLIAETDAILYDNRRGRLEMGTTNFSLPHIHGWGRADSFVRQDARINLENARFSFCDPHEETWYIKAERLKLDERNLQGNAHKVRLYTGLVPVFYLPYLAFPLGNQRQSGLLYPRLAVDQTNGLIYSQPYYFNLAPQADATTYGHLIQRRGFLVEQEFRWLTKVGQGTFTGGYITHDALYGKARGANYIKFSSVLHRGWSGELLWNQLSDQDYLADLPYSFPVRDDLALRRDAYISYLAPRLEWQFGWRNDQLLDTEATTRSTSYSQLPYMNFGYFSPTYKGFYLFDKAEYILFETERTSNLVSYDGRNGRLHNTVAFGWDGNTPWGFFKAEWGAAANRYALENGNAETDSRYLFIDTGVEFMRSLRGEPCALCLLSVQPRLYGLEVTRSARTTLPSFDTLILHPNYDMLFRPYPVSGNDELTTRDERRLSAGLEARVINQQGEEIYLGRVGRPFYFYPENNGSLIHSSPWLLDSSWRIRDKAYVDWSFAHDDERRLSQGLRLKYRSEKEDGFALSYYEDATKEESRRQLGSDLLWRFSPRWSLFSELAYDLHRDEISLGLGGFGYENCCVSTKISLYERETDEEDERGIVFQFVFKPLGGGDLGHSLLIRNIEDIYARYKELH